MRLNSPKILVANGVNLDLLGRREPHIYGFTTLVDIEIMLKSEVQGLAKLVGFEGCTLVMMQTNIEGEFLNQLDSDCDGILINAGAWTHTSLALADRLKGLGIPYVEVHISNTAARESMRHTSLMAAGAQGSVCGFGKDSYRIGLMGLLWHLKASKELASKT